MCTGFIALLTTSLSSVLYDKLTVPQTVKQFPVFYATRMFIFVFTRSPHLSVSWATEIQFMPPHPTS